MTRRKVARTVSGDRREEGIDMRIQYMQEELQEKEEKTYTEFILALY